MYDYIILGGGAAGLSLAYRMTNASFFDDKKIALIDKVVKKENDRTWCFWETQEGLFEDILYKKWDELKFYSDTFEKVLDIAPYRYKMLRGIDFYNHTVPVIEAASNIDYITDEIVSIYESEGIVQIAGKNNTYEGKQVFKSYPDVKNIDFSQEEYVDQHFKGFFIETVDDCFDPEKATFMDFRINQKEGPSFMYVLPESPTKALIEVAIFSNSILSQEDYDAILKGYITAYITQRDYKIHEEEFGIIPMTTYPFMNHNSPRIFHIGTGGGIVKASSGYAFSRIQKHSDQLIDVIVGGKELEESYKGLHGRHLFFDKIMLHAMLENGVSGSDLFTRLFKKNKANQIFKFLDQRTNLLEEFSIFRSPPFWPFVKSMFEVI